MNFFALDKDNFKEMQGNYYLCQDSGERTVMREYDKGITNSRLWDRY